NDLREPRVATVAADDVNRIAIERPERESFALEHKAQGWAFVGEDAPDFDPTADAVDRLVKAVTSAQAVGFEPRMVPDAAPPLAIITLGALSASEPEVLRVLLAFDVQGEVASDGDSATHYLVTRDGSSV